MPRVASPALLIGPLLAAEFVVATVTAGCRAGIDGSALFMAAAVAASRTKTCHQHSHHDKHRVAADKIWLGGGRQERWRQVVGTGGNYCLRVVCWLASSVAFALFVGLL
jgi:hypothetical protein